MNGQTIPHDFQAEEALIGSMLLSIEAVIEGIDSCLPEDFYNPLNARVFTAIRNLFARGIKIDPVTIAGELNDAEVASKLVNMSLNVPSWKNASEYGAIILKHSSSRKLIGEIETYRNLLLIGENPYEIASGMGKMLTGVGSMRSLEPQAMTISQLVANAEAIAPVVIPGMMHQDYRTIVVAEEGAGKSLLLRTIAMSLSQGIHPFSHKPIEPKRVLIIDLENPTQAITETAEPYMKHMAARVGVAFDEERLKVYRRPGGIEIRNLSDKAEVQREIAAHKPDLVVIGPIYKMYRRQPNETYEDSADSAMAVLDDLRTRYKFALVMEHHAAKGKAGERDLTPMGSQRWMAWPEIGISLYKDKVDETMLNVKRFRGDRLQGVTWPDRIVRHRTLLVEGIWD